MYCFKLKKRIKVQSIGLTRTHEYLWLEQFQEEKENMEDHIHALARDESILIKRNLIRDIVKVITVHIKKPLKKCSLEVHIPNEWDHTEV